MGDKNKAKKSCIDCSFCICREKEKSDRSVVKKFCCTLQNNKEIYNIENSTLNYRKDSQPINEDTNYPHCELGMWESK